MRNWLRLSLLVALLSVSSVALAQNATESCGTIDINRQIDGWYNEYLGQRGEFEVEQAVDAAALFAERVQTIVDACAVTDGGTEATIEQTGDGTENNPFVFGVPATIGPLTITVTGSIRPADQVLIDDGVLLAPSTDNINWVIVNTDVSCDNAQLSGCIFSEQNVRLVGDLGIEYFPQLASYDDYVLGSRNMPGGAQRSGGTPFEVNTVDTNLRLVYYGSGTVIEGPGSYFVAQEAVDELVVRSSNNDLLVRAGPAVTFGPVAVFPTGVEGFARGRNADTTWILVEVDGVEGWASAEFIQSVTNLQALPIVEP